MGAKAREQKISGFEQAAQRTRDAELRAWVGHTLPTLREHHAQASQLARA